MNEFVIGPRVTAFTAVCDECAAETRHGWLGACVHATLDLDLARGSFLCRRGHVLVVVREGAGGAQAGEAA
jgi:hypothetical protein